MIEGKNGAVTRTCFAIVITIGLQLLSSAYPLIDGMNADSIGSMLRKGDGRFMVHIILSEMVFCLHLATI